MRITLQDHAGRVVRPSILRDRVIPRESLSANEEHQVDLAGAVRTPQRIVDSTKEILRSLLYQQVPRAMREKTEVALQELHGYQMPTNRSRQGPQGQSVMQAPKESCDSNLGLGGPSQFARLRFHKENECGSVLEFAKTVLRKYWFEKRFTSHLGQPTERRCNLSTCRRGPEQRRADSRNPLPVHPEMLPSGHEPIPERFSK